MKHGREVHEFEKIRRIQVASEQTTLEVIGERALALPGRIFFNILVQGSRNALCKRAGPPLKTAVVLFCIMARLI